MSRKIKLHTFHFLFRMFAYLADKSGGWRVFVRPKLLLGSLILGFGLTATSAAQSQSSSQQRKKESPKDKSDTIRSKEVEKNVWCYVTEQMPQYPGGESALLNFVYKNLKYPASAVKDKIQGRVILRFVVTKTGEVDKVEVIRSLQPDCDKEAIRVVKMLPKFTPGNQSGKPVSIWYTMPVIFKLDNNVPKN